MTSTHINSQPGQGGLRELRWRHELARRIGDPKAKDWSQEAVAQRAGISRQAYGAIERGEARPSLATAIAIATVFEVEIEEICRRLGMTDTYEAIVHKGGAA